MSQRRAKLARALIYDVVHGAARRRNVESGRYMAREPNEAADVIASLKLSAREWRRTADMVAAKAQKNGIQSPVKPPKEA